MTLHSKINYEFSFLLFFVIIALISACTVAPIKKESIVIENPYGLKIPSNARLSIHMEPSQLNKTYVVQAFLNRFEIVEGRRIQDAANKVFINIFTTALPSTECRNPHLIANISGSSHVDAFWATYSADVIVTLTFGNGDFVGKYSANGNTKSGTITDSNALENAYILAFTQIATNILKEEKLILYFKNGFTDTLTAMPIN